MKKATTNDVLALCFSCNASLPSSVHFCPNCGIATLQNSQFFEKSTANFDPHSRHYKPWRDLPLVPKRNYVVENNIKKVVDGKVVSVTMPWCPIMKQLGPRKKKTKSKSLVAFE